MSSDIAIKFEGLNKCYHIYENPRDRLMQIFSRGRKYYKEFWALKDVSFEVKRGETVGIVGRNGSGKSTLLQLICGTLNPTSGSVRVNGRIAALLELGAGFNPEFTGRENVYMNGFVLGLTKEEIDACFDDIAAFADIGEFIEQPVKTYSSGMYVRLAFAVIAHVKADILVIDEALSVGDVFFVQKCMRFLRDFMEHGTVLFVSHDTGAVLNLCKRAIWLKGGGIELVGNPKTVIETYLADLQESKQGQSNPVNTDKSEPPFRKQEDFRDMRLDFINSTSLRNDIELFEFRPEAHSYGKGHAFIESVQLVDARGMPLSWVVGGEEVSLIIDCKFKSDVFSPIVGFYMKDRLGQYLFGDNTYIQYRSTPLEIQSGQTLETRFNFRMPVFPVGEYSICAAIAEGTQHEHVQHHWIHDALTFKSHSSSVCQGLMGVPMKNIQMVTL
jgi:lipopolysaccharide transport system ATP-binding protein